MSSIINYIKKKINKAAWSSLPKVSSTVCRLPPPHILKPGARIAFVGTRRIQPADKIVDSMHQSCINSHHYRPLYFNSSAANEEQALNQRVMKATLPLSPLIVNFQHFVRTNLFEILPKKRIRSADITQYLLKSNSTPSVKKSIKEAYDKLFASGITYNSSLDHSTLYSYSTRKSFVKVESMLYNSEGGTKQKAPRLIQGAKPEFVAIVGPWFSNFQSHMKRVLNHKNFIHFTSGSTSRKMGAFMEGKTGNVFENDISAYDSSIGVPLCELEIWIAKQFGAPKAVLDLMQANISTHGYTQNGWKYSVDGTRKSGDPYTSCFNSLLNILLHLFVYQLNTNSTIQEMKEELSMLVQGDDNLMVHVGDTFDWKLHFAELGFETVSTYRPDLFHAEFCSSVIVPVVEGLTFVPKFGRVLAKFGYFIDPPTHTHPLSLIRGTCLGFGHLSNMPLFRDLIGSGLIYSRNHTAFKFKNEEHKYKFSAVTCNTTTTYYMSLRLGVSMTQFEHIEWAVSLIFAHPELSVDPFVRLLFDKDTDGPQVIYN